MQVKEGNMLFTDNNDCFVELKQEHFVLLPELGLHISDLSYDVRDQT